MALITGTDGPDVLNGTAEDDLLIGGADDDHLYGGLGDDRMEGGDGDDMVQFLYSPEAVVVDLEAGTATGQGNDTFEGIEGVEGSGGDDILTGNGGDNRLYGGGGSDTIVGGDGNDSIDGDYLDYSGAADRVDGGGGDDVVRVGDNDLAEGGAGIDSLSIWLPARTEPIAIDLSALWTGGAGKVGDGTVTGFERLDFIITGRGNDVITLGTGGIVAEGFAPPLVHGGEGNDRLTGGEDRDRLVGGGGDDALIALGGDDILYGLDGGDWIEGGDGDDLVNGGPGADVLIGGAGDDIYEYGNGDAPAADRIVEQPDDAGVDRILVRPYLSPIDDSVFAGVRNIEVAELVMLGDMAGPEFVLGAEFQATGIGTVIASADIDASRMTTGVEFVVTRPNIRPMTVTGGSGDDVFRFGEHALPPSVYGYVISGGDGFDTLYLEQPIIPGWWAAEVVVSDFEAIVVAGGGDVGDDGAESRMAASRLSGSNLAVSNLSVPSRVYDLTLTDAMMEAGTQFTVDAHGLRGDGLDVLLLDVSQLTGGRAVRVLAGAGADELTGSVGNDALLGGGGDDALDGGLGADRVSGEAGNDVLRGGDGSDALDGGAGIDTLEGGAGADTMVGGVGDDSYIVDASGDRIVELAGQGMDTVRSSASHSLSDHVEQLILTGGGHINAGGNGLANTIIGNNGNNRLDGKAGADAMAGGTGHDVYVVDHALDQAVEAGSSGNDTVESAVSFALPTHFEKLILTGVAGRDGYGNSGANTIAGNAGGNLLHGGRGNDIIDGAAGNDRLMGHLGNDQLKGGAGADRFYFNVALGAADADRILDFSTADDSIWLLRSVFARAGANGTLAPSAFYQGTAAADASDRIVYDAATGRLFYDADGSGAGAAMLFATVTPGTALTHADFLIYG